MEWDESAAEKRGSAELFAEYRALAGEPGTEVRKDGDPESALDGAAKVLEADYEFPYLAHAPMEPMDCVIQLGEDRCEVWAGSQLQTVDQAVIAATVGLPPEKVEIHTLLGGGSFGRRATPTGDVAGEAASIAKTIGGSAPVKLLWTREDDIRGGFYRPMFVHRLRAGLDAEGNVVGWHQRIVGQSILTGTPFGALVQNGIDQTSVEGGSTLPYKIPALLVDLHTTQVGVPVLWWRSVGHTHNAYSTETFLDEVAHDAITLDEGRVVQSNFHDYRPLRIEEMPRIEVHIVPSTESPTGAGEPGVPPIAPAVANAWRQLTGKPARRLPFRSALEEVRS